MLYLSDEGAATVENLFVTALDGGSTPLNLTRHDADGHDVRNFVLTPDGTRAVYSLRLSSGSDEVRVVPLDGSVPPLTLASSYGALQFRFTADGTRVLYHAYNSTLRVRELVSVLLDASEPARTHGQGVGPYIDSFTLSPDGEWLVYSTDFRLFVVPLDGSVPAVERAHSVGDYVFARDGHLLCATAAGLFDLGPPSDPGATLLAELDSRAALRLTPDGNRVLYTRNELYLRFLARPHRPR